MVMVMVMGTLFKDRDMRFYWVLSCHAPGIAHEPSYASPKCSPVNSTIPVARYFKILTPDSLFKTCNAPDSDFILITPISQSNPNNELDMLYKVAPEYKKFCSSPDIAQNF
ncbi:conserved hypothetical protein [Ricinus communis]|uniref:Uncharacterized protein n=1 Tax=Ricinus communis TaxID=3988 RepID=B9SBM8_RICCO|nr:conserved hypothetical protein [Ricinus communis]